MSSVNKILRIAPAFDEPEQVRALFERHAPYRSIAEYIPRPEDESGHPYFRGSWAANGEALVQGAEIVLYNRRFIEAARTFFGTPEIRPTFVVVNLNAPMPPGPTHVDVPTFRGATRDQYPLGILIAMGASELFEQWRVIQAGAVSWFYEGPGGNFEYWPDGPEGPMLAERPPFHNVAIMADNDRMFHRIGRVGAVDAKLPPMTAAAEIRPAGSDAWEIVENGAVRATYPSRAIRLSIVWKADLETPPRVEPLTLDRVMDIFAADLRRRNVEFRIPTDPLSDHEWRASLLKVYAPAFASSKQ